MNTLFYHQCYTAYNSYFENRFQTYSTHNDLILLLQNCTFEKYILGQSTQGRDLYCIRVGTGPVKIMAWSQMHGNESTATGALLDLIRFFASNESSFRKEREQILSQISFFILPMINPDGAEAWTRTNALSIDLNRDALRQVAAESQILWAARQNIQPDIAFNLHDQESYYTANKHIPATISLLAPPIDNQNTVNSNRLLAQQMVCSLNNVLQNYIPGGVGRWDDGYEKRAFGEYFQQSGVATVLIESGGFPNDPLRYIARRLNFVALLHLAHQLAFDTIHKHETTSYSSIPINNKGMLFDVIYRNVSLQYQTHIYKADVGLRCYLTKVDGQIKHNWQVDDLGDLSTFAAYKDLHEEGVVTTTQNLLEKCAASTP